LKSRTIGRDFEERELQYHGAATLDAEFLALQPRLLMRAVCACSAFASSDRRMDTFKTVSGR
jgi:hypothetical protein